MIATALAEEAVLLAGLHTLGHHFEPQGMRHQNDGLHDCGIVRIAGEVADERPIDLELADRQALELAERGMAGTEIVHRDLHSEAFAHLRKLLQGEAALFDQQALCNLELEPLRVEAGALEDCHQRFGALAAQLIGREIDRQGEHRAASARHCIA